MMKIPKISETEWEVMKVVWEKAPVSAAEIIQRLASRDPTWHPRTAKTLLNRLVKKGALGFKEEGRAYLYRPLVKEADCAIAESQSFLERVFGGSLQPMLAQLVAKKKLSSAEIRELKRLLEEED
jgi:BlaI family penicillinase repressor